MVPGSCPLFQPQFVYVVICTKIKHMLCVITRPNKTSQGTASDDVGGRTRCTNGYIVMVPGSCPLFRPQFVQVVICAKIKHMLCVITRPNKTSQGTASDDVGGRTRCTNGYIVMVPGSCPLFQPQFVQVVICAKVKHMLCVITRPNKTSQGTPCISVGRTRCTNGYIVMVPGSCPLFRPQFVQVVICAKVKHMLCVITRPGKTN